MTKKKDPMRGHLFERRAAQLERVFANKDFQETVFSSLTEFYEKALNSLARAESTEQLFRAQGEYSAIRHIFDDLLTLHDYGLRVKEVRLKQLKKLTEGD